MRAKLVMFTCWKSSMEFTNEILPLERVNQVKSCLSLQILQMHWLKIMDLKGSIVKKWRLLIWYSTAYLVIDFDEKQLSKTFKKSCWRHLAGYNYLPTVLFGYAHYRHKHSCSSWFHLCHHFRLDILSILGHVSLCLIASDKRECLLTIRTNKCNVSINCDRNVFIAISSLYWLLISLKGCQQILI